uniref:Uncharacterized protein n=1 Tax=Schistocephalus solidus TaxID=70667 RepID=A0A0X3NMF3_SCHSO
MDRIEKLQLFKRFIRTEHSSDQFSVNVNDAPKIKLRCGRAAPKLGCIFLAQGFVGLCKVSVVLSVVIHACGTRQTEAGSTLALTPHITSSPRTGSDVPLSHDRKKTMRQMLKKSYSRETTALSILINLTRLNL